MIQLGYVLLSFGFFYLFLTFYGVFEKDSDTTCHLPKKKHEPKEEQKNIDNKEINKPNKIKRI